MTLTEALDRLYEGRDFNYRNWHNPIMPYFVSGVSQTAFEAYEKLKPEYQLLIRNWIGHEPGFGEE